MRIPPVFILSLAAAGSKLTVASAFSFAAPLSHLPKTFLLSSWTTLRRPGSRTSSCIGKVRNRALAIESSLRFADCWSYDDTLNKDGEAVASLHREHAHAEVEDRTRSSHHHDHHHSTGLKPLTALSILCWLISMLSHVRSDLGALRYAGLASVALGTPAIASRARQSLFVRRPRRVDASCMMLAASLGAVALGDLTEAAAVSSLFAVSESLEGRAEARSTGALSNVARDLGPGRAHLISSPAPGGRNDDGDDWKEKGELAVEIPADQVAVGSIVSVPVGDKLPCDGTVLGGVSSVDESSVTGESMPTMRGPGDAVPGGAVNAGPARLVVRTTATSSDSAVGRLTRLVEESTSRRSPTERLVDELAGRYAPPVFLAAMSMCTIPWLAFGPEVGRTWMRNGLVTLVAACPCPIVISTPVTYVAGLANMARQGIIVKGGAVLEALGKVEKICFDKTGTLTEGNFALQHLNAIGGLDKKEILEYLALMQSPSSHPLASALVKAVRDEGVSTPNHVDVQNHTILDGEGLVASIGGETVHVGNSRLFKRLGLYDMLPEADRKLADEWAASGETVGFLSIEGAGIVCSYSVADAIRPEARDVVRQLKDLGIDVSMLTGDGKDVASTIGNQIGLSPDSIYSQLLPDDKLNIISKMKEEASGSVVMCGDGVNDAPSLALADVGVAMGTGAALATETSDVTLTDPNLNKVLCSIKMGRRAIRAITQNIALSFTAKLFVVALAVAGISSLWAAIASDVGTMLLVTSNGLKLLPSRKENERA